MSSSSSASEEDDDALMLAQMTLTPKTALRSSKVMVGSKGKILSDSEEGEDEDEDEDEDHDPVRQKQIQRTKGSLAMHLAGGGSAGFKGAGGGISR